MSKTTLHCFIVISIATKRREEQKGTSKPKHEMADICH